MQKLTSIRPASNVRASNSTNSRNVCAWLPNKRSTISTEFIPVKEFYKCTFGRPCQHLRSVRLLLFPRLQSVYPSGSASTVAIAFPPANKQVVGLPALLQGFPNRYSQSSGKIGFRPILNNPTALLQEKINLLPSPLFRGHNRERSGQVPPPGSTA